MLKFFFLDLLVHLSLEQGHAGSRECNQEMVSFP